MVIKVGINGFGRVGRIVFRTCHEHPDFEVCAINDPAVEVDYICYLIKFDSTHGTLKADISYSGNVITINDVRLRVFQEKFPQCIPWHTVGAHYIVEASGIFTKLDKASGHLACDGVKRVIVTAPSADMPMVIFGVNECSVKSVDKVISCGSSTLYCLAPIVKVLEDNYGLEEGFLTSIHAMTPSLKPLDGLCLKGNHWRDHRSITQNIIPATTGACKALSHIIPSVKDRMCGLVFRVPIVNVSVLDLTVRLKKHTSLENIIDNVDKFGLQTKGIIKTNKEEAVSSDFIGDSYSCILDVNSSLQLKPDSYKLICWYENEYSYACRVVDLILFSESQFNLYTQEIPRINIQEKISLIKDVNEKTHVSLKNTVKPCIKVVGDSISNKSRLLPFKKPVIKRGPTFHNKAEKQIVLLSKLSNEEIHAVRHKPTSVFQACSYNSPYQPTYLETLERLGCKKQNLVCYRTQEHLARVKQEFTKMLHMTESLLKKTNESKRSLNDVENKRKRDENENIITLQAINASQTDTLNENKRNNSICNDLNGSLHCQTSNIDTINALQETDNLNNNSQSNTTINVSSKNLSLLEPASAKGVNIPDKGKCEIPDIRSNILDKDTGYTNSSEKLSKNMPAQSSDPSLIIIHEESDDKIIIIQDQDNDKKCEGDNLDITIELNNTISFDTNTSDEFKDDSGHSSPKSQSSMNEAEPKKLKNVQGHDVYEPAFIYKTGTTSTTYKTKEDIYDKLDSISTSSTSSFEINKKISQVITINDITSSLHDLDRLDKVCKIMEISHDLSEKLFTTKNSTTSLGGKRWSFRDFCERIKLDDFCNKIFASKS